MINPKFQEAKERLITSAQRVAGAYLLSKYGTAHLSGEPKVELTATEGPTSSSFVFSGSITCFAADSLLNQVGVNMTVNENDIEVTSEDIQANITDAVNSAKDQPEHVIASLDGFKLTDDGTVYLKVSHSDLQDVNIGLVGKNEYATSPNKSELLQNMVKDAMLDLPVTFTGEFKEPVIAKKECPTCKGKEHEYRGGCPDCGAYSGPSKDYSQEKEASLPTAKKSSWLTADLEVPELDENGNVILAEIDETKEVAKLAIQEDLPVARAHDSMAHMAQFEEQTSLEAQIKVEHEASNELLALLQGMGYGTAKTLEVTSSNDGLDVMTIIDDAGAVKAVSIPVSIKEGKVVLPKKALISTLIAKGLDIQAKLAEQFDLEVLQKLAAIEEKAAYEAAEAEAIIADMFQPVEKTAAGEKQPFFDSDDSTMTVQKHLLPNHEDLKVGDRLNDGVDDWEIVNEEGQQNDKNEGSSSQWTLKKVQGPERDGTKSKNKIPS